MLLKKLEMYGIRDIALRMVLFLFTSENAGVPDK